MNEAAADAPRRVLLTGARAPVTLELARLFAARGHEVCIAESVRQPLCRFSRAVRRTFHVPAPNHDLEGFADALARIITKYRIDVLLPTCEETFHVARIRARLPDRCRVVCEELPKLRQLHSKYAFIELARSLGLPAPATRRETSRAALEEDIVSRDPIVLKREFSRFGCGTLVRPTRREALDGLEVSEDVPWVVQEFIEGAQLCTYSVANAGKVVAHAAYPADWTAGQGATVSFAHAEHRAAERWVERFVEATGYTGQIAFDFIVRPDDVALPIDCNPRATSGAHLFRPGDGLCDALLGEAEDRITPTPSHRAMIALAMLLYGLPTAVLQLRLGAWLREFLAARDVIFRWRDPAPAFGQLISYLEVGVIALRADASMLEASTLDIEWNGEGEALAPLGPGGA